MQGHHQARDVNCTTTIDRIWKKEFVEMGPDRLMRFRTETVLHKENEVGQHPGMTSISDKHCSEGATRTHRQLYKIGQTSTNKN